MKTFEEILGSDFTEQDFELMDEILCDNEEMDFK